ncbi:hypothetical protein ACEN2I_06125 [Flavobacterium sp. W22_SRS_FK3]|uniref:hypothetical protein n=1 Tax=Flavobacterium sp. W22_SRS_FK3 TaxID=3240275 RepID=UPI003F8DFFE6
MKKVNMDSLITVLAEIERLGFTSQFEINGKIMASLKTDDQFTPSQIKIAHFYRFEGESSPDDSSIMYAIETNTNEKGTLIDAYGTAADPATADFIRKVKDIQK